jgi:hypothetical protein
MSKNAEIENIIEEESCNIVPNRII